MKNSRRDFLQLASVSTMGLGILAMAGKAAAEEKNSSGMDALTAIKTRHSVRSYTSQPVSDEDLHTIIDAAMMAPSAANEQPWELVVIKDPDKLLKVGEINSYASYAKNAPLAIMVCLNLGKEKIPGMGIIDVNLCAENILLAAHALNLGAVYTGVYPMKDRMVKFQELLGLPQNVLPIGLIVMGHPKIETTKPRESRYNQEAVHLDKWQGQG